MILDQRGTSKFIAQSCFPLSFATETDAFHPFSASTFMFRRVCGPQIFAKWNMDLSDKYPPMKASRHWRRGSLMAAPGVHDRPGGEIWQDDRDLYAEEALASPKASRLEEDLSNLRVLDS